MKNKNNQRKHYSSTITEGSNSAASTSLANAFSLPLGMEETILEEPRSATTDAPTEGKSVQFGGLTREQFITVELLKAGADLGATAEIVNSTNEEETTLKSFVAPAIKVASKNPTNTQAVVATAAVVKDLIKGNIETKNDFVKVAKVVDSLGVPLQSVTLADLV